MLIDIFNTPAEIEINGKKYKAEYDMKGYAMLETLTGKGMHKLYDLLMIQNNLTLNDSIEIICCSLLKHHSTDEISKVREYLTTNLYAIQEVNSQIIWAFCSPLLPPDVVNKVEDIKKKIKKMKPETIASIG